MEVITTKMFVTEEEFNDQQLGEEIRKAVGHAVENGIAPVLMYFYCDSAKATNKGEGWLSVNLRAHRDYYGSSERNTVETKQSCAWYVEKRGRIAERIKEMDQWDDTGSGYLKLKWKCSDVDIDKEITVVVEQDMKDIRTTEEFMVCLVLRIESPQ